MHPTTIAIDLAKNVFQIAFSNEPGRVSGHKRVGRKAFSVFLLRQKPARVVMEACPSAHHWGREARSAGHEVVLLPPAQVARYRFRDKTDRNDALALLEADRCGRIKPVPVKSVFQQEVLMLHRLRRRSLKSRTQCINAMRAQLRELGVFASGSKKRLRDELPTLMAELSEQVQWMLCEQLAEWNRLDERVDQIDKRLNAICRQDPVVRTLLAVNGIGPITATAMVAMVGDVSRFARGRQFSAWLGLTPGQYSSGEKTRMLGITKAGDTYLRTLLIHGGRSLIRSAKIAAKKGDGMTTRQHRLLCIEERRGYPKASVAAANKIARWAWAVWYHGRTYDADYQPA